MPIPLIFLAGAAGAFFLAKKKPDGGQTSITTEVESSPWSLMSSFAPSVPSNEMNLPDILPGEQGGSLNQDYDSYFAEIGERKGVPFALLKAHAYRESSLNAGAFRQEPSGKASYGLMQILWWKDSQRFQDWGYSDDAIGDGSLLYDPTVNIEVACEIILDNWNTHGNLRDMINAYNTGVAESRRVAPYDYVNRVIATYSTLIKRSVQ